MEKYCKTLGNFKARNQSYFDCKKNVKNYIDFDEISQTVEIQIKNLINIEM